MGREFAAELHLVDHYDSTSLSAVLTATESAGAGIESIRSTFAGFAAASEDWAQGRGCLLCNTAVERAVLDPSGGDRVDAYFERLTQAFRSALQTAQAAGEINASANIKDLAGFLTMALVEDRERGDLEKPTEISGG